MVNYSTETAFILHLLKGIYKTPKIQCPPLQDVDVIKLLRFAARNNVGYYTAKLLSGAYGNQLPEIVRSELDEIITQSETLLLALHDTAAILDSNLDEYLLHKTYRGYPRIPSDIDTLVPDLHVALEQLQSAGLKIKEEEGHAIMLIGTNGIKVHLHDRITWADSCFFDNEFILQNPRKANLWEVHVNIPSINADFLIHIAHINFEPLHFTLSDFLYLCKLAPFVNWAPVLEQVRKYNWIRSFTRTLSLINEYHCTLYPRPHPFESLNLKNRRDKYEIHAFPKDLPRTQIALAFLEKKPFSYLLSKLSKSIQIMATGDTYQAYYNPPELAIIKKTLSSVEQEN